MDAMTPQYRRTGTNNAGVAPIVLATTWKGFLPSAGDWLLPASGVYAYLIERVVETGHRLYLVELTVKRDWRDAIPADATFHAWEWKQRGW
jgi:hypothetical protein